MKIKFFLLFAGLFELSSLAHADTLDQNGILRSPQGQVRTLKQADAFKACAGLGMHLPTIRELVKLSRAAGIILKERNEVTKEEVRIGGFNPVSAVNPNGTVDMFFYSNDNYARPIGSLGANSFWSSSAVSGDLFTGYGLDGNVGSVYSGLSATGYPLYGKEGDPYGDYRDDGLGAVRCVAGH